MFLYEVQTLNFSEPSSILRKLRSRISNPFLPSFIANLALFASLSRIIRSILSSEVIFGGASTISQSKSAPPSILIESLISSRFEIVT